MSIAALGGLATDVDIAAYDVVTPTPPRTTPPRLLTETNPTYARRSEIVNIRGGRPTATNGRYTVACLRHGTAFRAHGSPTGGR